jgi:hypothetical protein
MKLTLLKKPKIITSSVIILIILIASVTFLILKFNFKEEKDGTASDTDIRHSSKRKEDAMMH